MSNTHLETDEVEAPNTSPINRTQSNANRLPMPYNPYPPSTSTEVPSGLKSWYSNYVFRTVTFFFMMVAVLSISSAAFFTGKLSADQFLGIISSLLFLATPSPLQNKPKKKIVYTNVHTTSN